MNFDNSHFDEDCERCSPLRRHAKVEAHISLDALRRNLRQIRSITPQARICCVVKADAYGHGAPMVCRALQQEGIKDFAVSGITEATRSAFGTAKRYGTDLDFGIYLAG